MEKLRFAKLAGLLCGHLALVAVGLLVSTPIEAKAASVDSAQAERAIIEILYSNTTNEEKLSALAPYVSVGDSLKMFKKKTGLDPGICIGSGPGVMHCFGMPHGLELVADSHQKIRIIRRAHKVVDGVDYPELSLTSNCMQQGGYTRCYEN